LPPCNCVQTGGIELSLPAPQVRAEHFGLGRRVSQMLEILDKIEESLGVGL
jgi:hypothetical protein